MIANDPLLLQQTDEVLRTLRRRVRAAAAALNREVAETRAADARKSAQALAESFGLESQVRCYASKGF